MKLATYQDGSRDGQLVVVSRDLSTAHYASGIAGRLQQVLDDWNFISPQLQDLYVSLNQGRARHGFPFDPAQCMAPLPRAYQRVNGSAYSHPAQAPGDLTLVQCSSDDFLGPCDDVRVASEDLGIDFAAQLAVVTGDVPQGADPDTALEGVRLLMLVNELNLRQFSPPAQNTATAFGPVAVTPDELGEAWQGGRVHLTLQTAWNGRRVGLCDTGPSMHFHFGQLIAQACMTRSMRAGSIIGSGTVSHPGLTDAQGKTEWPQGYHCIADKRAIETLQDGQPSTAFIKWGDTVRMEVKGREGHSVWGAIDQKITPLKEPHPA